MNQSNFFWLMLSGTILIGCSSFTTIQPRGGTLGQAKSDVAQLSVYRVEATIVPESVRDQSSPVFIQIKNLGNQTILASATHFTLTTATGAVYEPIFVPPWQPTPVTNPSTLPQPQAAPSLGDPSPTLPQPQPENPQPLPTPNTPSDREQPPSQAPAVPPVSLREPKLPATKATEITYDSSKAPSVSEALFVRDSSSFAITQTRFSPGFRGGISSGYRGGGFSGYRSGFSSGYRGGFGSVRVAPPATRFGGRPGFYGRPWGGVYRGWPLTGVRPWGYRPWPYYSRGWYGPYGYFGTYGWYPGLGFGLGIYGLPPFGVGMYGYPYYLSPSAYYDEGEEPNMEQLMYQQSLPSMQLRPGEQASGFVFFPKIDTNSNPIFYLHWEVHNEQNQVISQLQIPVTIEENSN